MFGFLKKKLKENIDRIAKRVESPGPKPEEPKAEETKPVIEKVVKKEEPTKEIKPVKPEVKEVKLVEPETEPKKPEPEVKIEDKPEESKEPKKKEKKTLRGRLFGKKPKEEKLAGTQITRQEKPAAETPEPKKGFLKRAVEEKDLKDLLWELQVSLLESDVALETAEKICNDLKESLVGKDIKKGKIGEVVKENIKKSLFDILDQEQIDLMEKVSEKKPFLIIFLGFNGSGKTTAIARIAHLFKENGLHVNMAAGDTWRAAAINQLEKHGHRLKVPVVKHDYGADSAAVIYDAVKHAEARDIDVVLADTAGRTHTNVNLMRELEKIIKVNKPDMKLLVIDSLTGNDAVEQARSFEETVGVDGIILTKMDVNEKGGAALSVAHTIGKPIIYIGTGQEYGDLEKFNPRKIIQNLLE